MRTAIHTMTGDWFALIGIGVIVVLLLHAYLTEKTDAD
jgi:hypothetical protein